MADTQKLSLPLLSPSQAQKHVTVNEALVRLDAAVQLTAAARDLTVPPAAAADGTAYIVPPGAVNAWAGQGGRVAVRLNGGWIFLVPQAGWRAFVTAEHRVVVFDGTGWAQDAVAVASGGSALALAVREFDHAVSAGATSLTPPELPANAIVFGITGRVVEAIGGTLDTWRVGVADSDNRYGSGIGVAQGAWLRGVTGSPLAYYAPTPLLMTAEGGEFDGSGTVRFAIHYALPGLPRPV
jgi:hypothetical protein